LFVLSQSTLRFLVHRWDEQLYTPVYWTTEFLGLLAGCWIVLEIYQVALAAYPGTAKMARRVLLFLFALAVTKAAVSVWNDPRVLLLTTPLQLEKMLRTVQAIAIVALITVFASYSIPFGRNLRGILFGYGLVVGERVICLTFVPPQGHHFWFYACSAYYVVALSVWVGHLYQPSAVPVASLELEQDYQRTAAVTRHRLHEAGGYLRKAVRP
jgi:hypothetical protein